jgi:hypothetical protein
MHSSAQVYPSRPLPTSLRIAAVLAWVWGILIIVFGMVLFTLASQVSPGQGLGGIIAAVFACSIVYCALGYGLGRGRRLAIWSAIGFTALVSLGSVLTLLTERRPGLIIALIFNQVLFWLVVVGFTRLVATERSGVGA